MNKFKEVGRVNVPALNVPSVKQVFNVFEGSPQGGQAFVQNANFT